MNDYETYDNGKKIVGTVTCEMQVIDADNYPILIDNGYYEEEEIEPEPGMTEVPEPEKIPAEPETPEETKTKEDVPENTETQNADPEIPDSGPRLRL